MKKLLLLTLIMTGMNVLASDPLIVAHRMGAGERDENVLASLEECHAKGIKAFETDIRITKDDQIIATHDGSLMRRCGVEGVVEDMTLEEIKKVRTKDGNPLPTLKELLTFLKDKDILMQLELKTNGDGKRLRKLSELMVKELKEAEFGGERLLVISFCLDGLKFTKEFDPKINTGYLCGGSDEKNILAAKEAGCGWISAELATTTRRFADKVHKEGMKLASWTIRADRDFVLAKDLEADAIVTDFPEKYSKR
ncbi:hypothetical protein J6X96_04630 [bacterium]|nr:hypothetical protein [bacterium]